MTQAKKLGTSTGSVDIPSSPVSLDQRVEVSLLLRSQRSWRQIQADVRALARTTPQDRQYADPNTFAHLYGASQADLDAVQRYAANSEFDVVSVNSFLGFVVVSSTIGDLQKAMKVQFSVTQDHEGLHLFYEGSLHFPAKMAPVIAGVVGLHHSPSAPHMHHIVQRKGNHVEPSAVANFYDFPEPLLQSPSPSSEGSCIGLIELGGGFYEADVLEQFKTRYRTQPPKITVISVDSKKNAPASRKAIWKYLDEYQRIVEGDKLPKRKTVTGSEALDESVRWTIEVSMDIQLSGALYGGERLAVYFAPNTEQGRFHAMAAAISDRKNNPSVISCSWGVKERDLHPDFIRAMEHLMAKAALLGITVCCSSGDTFLQPNETPVYYPASSPYVLGCGGTHVDLSRSQETCWNEELTSFLRLASTGGASRLFRAPAWQIPAKVRQVTGRVGRGVPDVAAKADLVGGYCMRVAGRDISMGGTSASAPVWAALINRVNQAIGARLGHVTPLLYRDAFRQATRSVDSGSNGVYQARPGWDACTGLGSPRGRELLRVLSKKPVSDASRTDGRAISKAAGQ